MNNPLNFTRSAIAGVLASALLLTTGSHAQSSDAATESPVEEESVRAESMGPLADILNYGPDGAWIGETDGNGFRLINPETPNDIKYYFLNTEPEYDGQRTIEVETAVLEGNGLSGLLYGFQNDPKQYYLLTVDREGVIRLMHRTPEGPMEEKFSAEGNSEDGDEPAGPTLVKLTMIENGEEVDIRVNDESLGTFEGSATGTGALGIVAVDQIDALFLNFDLWVRE